MYYVAEMAQGSMINMPKNNGLVAHLEWYTEEDTKFKPYKTVKNLTWVQLNVWGRSSVFVSM